MVHTKPALLASNQPSLTGTVLAASRALLCPIHYILLLLHVVAIQLGAHSSSVPVPGHSCSGFSWGSCRTGYSLWKLCEYSILLSLHVFAIELGARSSSVPGHSRSGFSWGSCRQDSLYDVIQDLNNQGKTNNPGMIRQPMHSESTEIHISL